MNKTEPRTLPGFMELLPQDQILFNQIKETIRRNYEKFGFLPLDTPIIEDSKVLLAKAGGETEKQIYRFNKGENDLSLRFDLTVPLAKYVAKNYGTLAFPFRRYQIGKVYRGERQQKGRYREFYQCDIDIIGDGELSIINDAELPNVIYNTFKELEFGEFTICINNRKILNGLFESLELNEISADILRIIDKIEKIGKEAVIEELEKLNIEDNKIEKIMNFIAIEGSNDEKIKALNDLGITSEKFQKGLEELTDVVKYMRLFGIPEENFKIDLTIARGLDYYTGTVYETFLNEYKNLGSICSGGRYENLAEYYTDKKLPGVGISIGLTRLFYQLNEIKLLKTQKKSISDILVISMTENFEYVSKVASKLRDEGKNVQVYYEDKKVKAKFKYADKLEIPYTVVIGDDEVQSNSYSVKNMTTGEQESYKL
jgi:histidyl-tRNA synthetase